MTFPRDKRGASNSMMPSKLPPGKTEMWAIVYNPGNFEGEVALRAFDTQEKAWAYGRIMSIEPLKISVEQAQALKLVKSA